MNNARQGVRRAMRALVLAAALATTVGWAGLNPGTGDVRETEADFTDVSPHALHFTRQYRSSGNLAAGLGGGWSHNWAASLTQSGDEGQVRFGKGSVVLFSRTGSRAPWVAGNGRDGLAQNAGGWLYTQAATETQWQFDTAGRLVAHTARNGWRTVLTYDDKGRLSKVVVMKDGEAADVRYLHNALGQRVFKSQPEIAQTLPNEDELGIGFVNWLRKNFGWMFQKCGKTSLGQAFVYGDGEIPAWAMLGEYGVIC